MDLVHDHPAHILQLLPKAGRAEKDGQGLGCGVEDVRSPLQHAGLFLGRDVSVPDGVPDLLHFQPSLLSQGLHLLQGPLQVFVNIIGQRLEGRDVEAVDHVFQLALCSHDEELVDDGDEGGEGLARAGGRADEHVLALLDEGHAQALGRSEEAFGEAKRGKPPVPHDGVEEGEEGGVFGGDGRGGGRECWAFYGEMVRDAK